MTVSIDFEQLQAEQEQSSGTDVDDKGNGGKKRDEWLKFTAKGQTIRGAFVYYHDVAQVAFGAATRAKKTMEEVKAAATQAVEERASALGKAVDQLTQVDRLHTDKAQFRMLSAHYQEGLGYVLSRLGLDGAEADRLWRKLPEPKKYFTSLLLVYPTDRDGNVDREVLKARLAEKKFTFLPYRFSGKTYDLVWNINDGLRSNDLEISSQDLIIECEDVQYQRVAIRPAGKAIYRLNPQVMRDVLDQAVAFYPKLNPFRAMTTDELRAKLLGTSGGSPNGGGAGAPATNNFEDMLASL